MFAAFSHHHTRSMQRLAYKRNAAEAAQYDNEIERTRVLSEIDAQVAGVKNSRAQQAQRDAFSLSAPDTSALIGASRPEQVTDCVGALNNLSFTTEELAEIDRISL